MEVVAPAIHATIKRICTIAAGLALLACTAASCGPRHSAAVEARCAFSDPEFTTSMGICNLAAEYYVAHHKWPLTKAQLDEQNRRLLEKARAEMSSEEAKELSEFLDRFTLLDLRKQGDDLVLHYRFKIKRKTVDRTITLRPRLTTDEILEAATAKGYD